MEEALPPSLDDISSFLKQTNSCDERGLCCCPEWSKMRSCGNRESCWLHHEGVNCQSFTLGRDDCSDCQLTHSVQAREYHQTPRPCIYSENDAEVLRQCNTERDDLLKHVCLNNSCSVAATPPDVATAPSAKGKEEAGGKFQFHLHRLFDTEELAQYARPLVMLDLTRDKMQIQCVCKFLLACGARWREKVQLLELWFRVNGLNTWITSQTHIERGTLESPDGDYLHFPLTALKTVAWDDPTQPCEYKLNISTLPKLESVKEMLRFNCSYTQSFERLPQAGMLVVKDVNPEELHTKEAEITQLQQQLSAKESELQAANVCTICRDAPKNTKLIPCNHLGCCAACAKRLCVCPFCRIDITGYDIVFHV